MTQPKSLADQLRAVSEFDEQAERVNLVDYNSAKEENARLQPQIELGARAIEALVQLQRPTAWEHLFIVDQRRILDVTNEARELVKGGGE